MTTQIITGDCRSALAAMPAESVHMVVTSPPYCTTKARWNHTRNGRDELRPPQKRVSRLRTKVKQGQFCLIGRVDRDRVAPFMTARRVSAPHLSAQCRNPANPNGAARGAARSAWSLRPIVTWITPLKWHVRGGSRRMSAQMKVSFADQIACVKRELAMRERVYPRFVASGRMTQAKADHELAAMRAALETLIGCFDHCGLPF